MNTSQNDLQAWIGRSETVHDTIVATPLKALDATLDHPARPIEPGTPLPPLWHWLYFLPLHRQSEIGPDGHAKRGGFLPPVRSAIRLEWVCCRRWRSAIATARCSTVAS